MGRTQLIVSCVVFILMILWGIYVGAPIAIQKYGLTIHVEVKILFLLMPFVYFFGSLPLCFASGYCFKFVSSKGNSVLNVFYVLISSIFAAVIFYGVGVSLYYG